MTTERYIDHRDGGYDVDTWVDVFGPDGHAGRVVACTDAEQAHLRPYGPGQAEFSTACEHLLAREVCAAYDAGSLDLASPFTPARHPIDVAFEAVDEVLASGVELPTLEPPGFKAELGSIQVSETYGHWPLTFGELVEEASGAVVFSLEVDAEDGPILTFDARFPADALAMRRPVPAGSPDRPLWRAVSVVMIDPIRAGLDEGRFPVPDGGCWMRVRIDREEAVSACTDPHAFAELARRHPTEWPA